MQTYTIHTDGGARGNPGPAAIGFVVKQADQVVAEVGERIGSATNNTAEYQAVVRALEWLLQTAGGTAGQSPLKIDFFLDSKLVVNQLAGNYKIKQEHLRSLATIVHDRLGQLNATASFTYIPREQNAQADTLLNQALDRS